MSEMNYGNRGLETRAVVVVKANFAECKTISRLFL